VPGTLRLLSPDTYHVPAEGVWLMALTEHVTVGSGDSQRSGWHLANPKVRSQDRARVREISAGSACGSSSSELSNQPGNGCQGQHPGGRENGDPRSAEIAHGNDQTQQDDQDCDDRSYARRMKLAQTILYEQDVEQAAAFYQRVFELERGEVKRGYCGSRHQIR
jgi:hypothetical protein